jgi:hypothetical protein
MSIVCTLAWLRWFPTETVPAVVLLQIPLLLIAGLMYSTPPNAIRLVTWQSVLLILVTAELFQLAAKVPVNPIRILCVGAGVLLLTAGLTRARLSVWWAVPVAWNPLLVLLGTPN